MIFVGCRTGGNGGSVRRAMQTCERTRCSIAFTFARSRTCSRDRRDRTAGKGCSGAVLEKPYSVRSMAFG
jgi:hypothetical protein